MSVLHAIETIKEIATDINEKFGCLRGQRRDHARMYTNWDEVCYTLSDDNCDDKLAYRLLEDVTIDDGYVEYHVSKQTVIDCVNIATNTKLINSDSDIEDYLLALDYDVTESWTIAKEVFDKDDELLTGKSEICSECYRGTHEQWMKYLLDCEEWYNEYVSYLEDNIDEEDDDEEIPTIHEWALEQINKHTESWTGDLSYKRL